MAMDQIVEHSFELMIPRDKVQQLKFVTPGDFAVVNKTAGFWGEGQSVTKLIELLHNEVAVKNENLKTLIGFRPT